MIKVKRRFKRFDTGSPSDIREYEEILDDSLCTITDKDTVSETTKIFDDEGKLSELIQRTIYLVHWEEQIL